MRPICFEKDTARLLLVKALRPMWPGVVYSSFSPTQLKEIPDEPLPGPHWLRVRNRICGICATDLHLLLVEADLKTAAVALPGASRIYLGHEVIGVVSEIGSGVTSLKVGDRVIMDSRAVMSPTCLSQEIDPPCRHCGEGNYQLCENASLRRGAWQRHCRSECAASGAGLGAHLAHHRHGALSTAD